jgi:hypothetical protein
MVVWDLWPPAQGTASISICSFPSSNSSALIYTFLPHPQPHISSLVLTTVPTLFHILNGFVALSTFRISHAHPIFNWFSEGTQDARYSTCFF